MKYYANINSHNDLEDIDTSIMTEDKYGSVHVKNIEVDEQHYNNAMEYGAFYYIYAGGEIIENPDYEQEKEEKEKEEIKNLKCTKRVFALALKQLGITYQQLKELIATNDDAQLEWDLCVELSRDNPLLDQMCGQLCITPQQIDDIFKYANGLINQEENGNV
jgi:hypothetical protein